MKIKNLATLDQSPVRHAALYAAEAALEAIDTQSVLKEMVRLEGDQLCVGDHICSLHQSKRIFFIGIGKCAIEAAMALEHMLEPKLAGGIVLDVQMPELCILKKIECHVGTHPMPTETNVEVTKKIVQLLTGLTREDVVLIFVSGGGSTLLCLPNEGSTCVDEALILKSLFAAGATIQEINTIRKHISLARGGQLAKYAYPAQVIALISSDVPGNDLSFIASGPTIKDETTVYNAADILARYHIQLTQNGKPIDLLETPKEDMYFRNVTNLLLVSNDRALEAMKISLEKSGYKTTIITNTLSGEARLVARTITAALHAVPPKTALLYAGETTVTITGSGTGGRNQELALAGLEDIHDDELILTLASDGRDNSDAAGAVCDILTKKHAQERGLNPAHALEQNDSYPFFDHTQDRIVTGHTGSNISDLILALKE